MSVISHFINGEHITCSGHYAEVFNPATGQVSAQLALADSATVQTAIDAAQNAFPAWRATPPGKRAQTLFRFKQLLEQHQEEVADLISLEHGKTFEDAVGEIKRGIENIEYASAATELLKGEHSRNVGPGIDGWSEFAPP